LQIIQIRKSNNSSFEQAVGKAASAGHELPLWGDNSEAGGVATATWGVALS
jgi:hypothetical protein